MRMLCVLEVNLRKTTKKSALCPCFFGRSAYRAAKAMAISLNNFAISLKLAEDSTPQFVVTEAEPVVDCCRDC